jgi:hypothetical protein
MSSDFSLFEGMATEAMREFALNRSVALAKYSDLLERFGKGSIQPTTFNEAMLKLAIEEGTRYAQDTIKLGGAYLGFMSKLTSSPESGQPQSKAARSGPKPRQASRASAPKSRARARRAQK